MKIIKSSLLFMLVTLLFFECYSQTSEHQNTKNVTSENVLVYYFHNTARCATCNAVENETKLALEMFYADKMKAGTMDFISLNIQEDEGEKMAQSLRVSGQTLLIVKGETHLNLTNEGFMNARTNPDKFHEMLKTQIDKLL